MTMFLTVATSVISSGAFTAFMTKRLEAKIRYEERIEQAMATILSDLDDWRMATSASATEIYNVAIDRENDDGVKPRLTKETTELVVKKKDAVENALGLHFPELLSPMQEWLCQTSFNLTFLATQITADNTDPGNRANTLKAYSNRMKEIEHQFSAFKATLLDHFTSNKQQMKTSVWIKGWTCIKQVLRQVRDALPNRG